MSTVGGGFDPNLLSFLNQPGTNTPVTDLSASDTSKILSLRQAVLAKLSADTITPEGRAALEKIITDLFAPMLSQPNGQAIENFMNSFIRLGKTMEESGVTFSGQMKVGNVWLQAGALIELFRITMIVTSALSDIQRKEREKSIELSKVQIEMIKDAAAATIAAGEIEALMKQTEAAAAWVEMGLAIAGLATTLTLAALRPIAMTSLKQEFRTREKREPTFVEETDLSRRMEMTSLDTLEKAFQQAFEVGKHATEAYKNMVQAGYTVEKAHAEALAQLTRGLADALGGVISELRQSSSEVSKMIADLFEMMQARFRLIGRQ
jgi:hypothetical protein